MPQRQAITIPSDDLRLEGQLFLPEGPAQAAVAICHPHPAYGGDMSNNVVRAIEHALHGLGVACLRFNFRGVGASEGEYDGKTGEVDDARAALAYLRTHPNTAALPLGLAGYSFGGWAALQAASHAPGLAFLILVAPALRALVPGAEQVMAPKLIVIGERDNLISSAVLQHQFEQLAPPKAFEIVPTADHFWFGRERLLEEVISRWWATTFPAG